MDRSLSVHHPLPSSRISGLPLSWCVSSIRHRVQQRLPFKICGYRFSTNDGTCSASARCRMVDEGRLNDTPETGRAMEHYGVIGWIVIGGLAGACGKLLMPVRDP